MTLSADRQQAGAEERRYFMASVKIAYDPALTLDKVRDILVKRFCPPYELLERPGLIGVDFAIRRSNWTAMAIRYKPKSNTEIIKLIFNAYTPSVAIRLLLNGLVPMLILLFTSWRKMTNEFREFIRSCPEFRVID
jgi:hypothetical protein